MSDSDKGIVFHKLTVRVTPHIYNRIVDMSLENEMSINEFCVRLFKSYISIHDKQLKTKPMSHIMYEES